VAAGAATGATLALSRLGGDEPWLRAGLLAAAAAAAQLTVVPTGRNHGFHTGIAFVVAAALLLPLEFVALVALAQHLPEGLWERRRWYIQTFNVASATVSALLTAVVARAVGLDGSNARWAFAGLLAIPTYVLVNHVLLAVMLRLARGHSLRASGLFSLDGLAMDAVVAGLGVVTAAVWQRNPWLVPAAVAPLALSQRTFLILALLRDSEQRFRAMFESASVGVALLDLEGRFVSVNAAFEQMLQGSDLIGREYGALQPAGGEEQALFAGLVASERSDYRLERKFEAADGRIVDAHVAAALVRDADDKPRYVIAMVQDTTERHELEDQLRQAQKMEAVGLLAGGIAHDFNNILTAITGFNEFALHRIDAGLEPPREDLLEIRSATERAASLTRQLLAFGRKQIVQPRVLDLRDVVRNVELLLGRLIGQTIDVVHVLSVEPCLVKADETQLEQVLVNLAVNARDAMPGSGRLTIGVAPAGPGGERIALTVADTGCGMDAETKSRIFEPFFTTKAPGEGTGLGLSTVYGIATQAGGSIAVDTAPGAGTTFRIELPRLSGELAEGSAPVATARVRGGHETVLLVEDESVVRTLLREVLKSEGYTVLEAASGNDAIRIVERRAAPADLVVSDIVMPGMTGFDVWDRLRLHWPNTPVLFISGYADADAVANGIGRPGTHLLPKPFAPVELARKVREVLDGAPREVVAA
jgi:PAS domain S-box-containing protein